MKLRPTKFVVREHTASPRQHASRLAVDSLPSLSEILPKDSQHRASASVLASRASECRESVTTKPLDTATGGEGRPSAELSPVPATSGAANQPGQAFEPLIGSEAAAKLLGNIHVKTLQRYARRGALPGYRVAGHWYFRATELDRWLRTRINSSCHPCRSN
jgi:excisionase family DNA binding protein